MNIYDVIIRPLETEKAYSQRSLGQYVFIINANANKLQVQQAVEEIYNVEVASVNVMRMPAKVNHMRGRRRVVRRAVWKKAVVTLAPGKRIEQLEA